MQEDSKTKILLILILILTKKKKENAGLPFLLGTYGVIGGPVLGIGGYFIWNPKKKKYNTSADEDAHPAPISKEVIKKVMELEDVPYQGDDYIPNVPRHVDACIINTEEETQENENTL